MTPAYAILPRVRRFEYAADKSAKFWEVARDGTEVTVRYGRLGTDGRTQVKDLADETAAVAHVDKLVAEKLKKGYAEVGEAPPADTPATPKKAESAQAESDSLPDETTWTLPSTWARQAVAFRGLRPAPKVKLNFEFDHELPTKETELTVMHPKTDPDLQRNAMAFSDPDSRGDHDDLELGAGALVTGTVFHLPWSAHTVHPRMADGMVESEGVAFAAAAAAHAVTIAGRYEDYDTATDERGTWLERLDPESGAEADPHEIDEFLARMRAHLAAADDATYADAVARLRAVREAAGEPARLVTSYLAPTEGDWVEADCADLASLASGDLSMTMLLASATTEAQVRRILDKTGVWCVAGYARHAYTLGANLGPASAPLFAEFLDTGGWHTLAEDKRRLLGMLAEIPTDEAMVMLLDRIEAKYVQPAVLKAIARFPARGLRLLAQRAGSGGVYADLLRGHLLSHPGLADRLDAELDDTARAAIAAATPEEVTVADDADIPALLAAPPWTHPEAKAKPIVVAGLESPGEPGLRWLEGEREHDAELPVYPNFDPSGDWEMALSVEYSDRWGNAIEVLAIAPHEVGRPYLKKPPPTDAYAGETARQRLLASYNDRDAVEYVLALAESDPTASPESLLPIEGPVVAEWMAGWLVGKPRRRIARAWLHRHPESAARDLIPAALDKPGKRRTAGETALRELTESGHGDVVRAAAAAYGEDAAAAIDAFVDTDPLYRLPTRIPALPAWVSPTHLPPIRLAGSDAALGPAAVENLLKMLALCEHAEPYAGIEQVYDALDADDLAEFSWALFERWKGAGFPTKGVWVFEALGLFGDDDTVRRLTPLIRAWPGESGHARAVAGLDVLLTIETEVALMHLNGIAERTKFAGLQEEAQKRIDAVAEVLELTPDELADRLVPDFGLDRDGAKVLDYGPRRFTVGFDEQLRPTIFDEDGSRRKTLPKPGAKDDSDLAPAAYEAFRALRADVKTIAAEQVRRLERAMVLGRRWQAADAREYFFEHPLLWHLARRLVWATFDADNRPTGSFRIAEDRSLADVEDEELTLDPEATVGVAHPLALGDAVGAWSDVLADYEILQPFEQLGRGVWQLTDDERDALTLRRLGNEQVPTGRVLGLSHRGWERGPVEDAGVTLTMVKPAGPAWLVMSLDPGIVAGHAMEWDQQQVEDVWLTDDAFAFNPGKGKLRFAELDDVSASELIRDLEHLRS